MSQTKCSFRIFRITWSLLYPSPWGSISVFLLSTTIHFNKYGKALNWIRDYSICCPSVLMNSLPSAVAIVLDYYSRSAYFTVLSWKRIFHQRKLIISSWGLSHPSRSAVLYTASVHANSRSWDITHVDPGHDVHVWIPVCLQITPPWETMKMLL